MNFKTILLVLVGFVAFVVATAFVLGRVYKTSLDEVEISEVYKGETGEFALPRLEVKPLEQLQKLRAAEAKDLQSYSWNDNEHRFAKVPVERAMQELVSESSR